MLRTAAGMGVGMGQQIFIVDDDAAVRDSLRMMLQAAGYQVEQFASAQEFLPHAARQGCLIADIRMPGMTGLELQEELASRGIQIPVIIITGHGDVPLAVRAMRAGAIDFIEKPFDESTILASLARAFQAGRRKPNAGAQATEAKALLGPLTPREREVANLLVAGSPNKLVAHELGISPRTVEIHRAKIMEKIKGRNLSDLVRTVLAAQD